MRGPGLWGNARGSFSSDPSEAKEYLTGPRRILATDHWEGEKLEAEKEKVAQQAWKCQRRLRPAGVVHAGSL